MTRLYNLDALIFLYYFYFSLIFGPLYFKICRPEVYIIINKSLTPKVVGRTWQRRRSWFHHPIKISLSLSLSLSLCIYEVGRHMRTGKAMESCVGMDPFNGISIKSEDHDKMNYYFRGQKLWCHVLKKIKISLLWPFTFLMELNKGCDIHTFHFTSHTPF